MPPGSPTDGVGPAAGPVHRAGGLAVRLHALLMPDYNRRAAAWSLALQQARRQGGHLGVQFLPAPAFLAPDQRGLIRQTAGILGQQMRQIHGPIRHGLYYGVCHHFKRSRIET